MDKLIIKHLAFDTTSLDFASVKYFAETGQITGNLLIRLRNMLKEASEIKSLNDVKTLHDVIQQNKLYVQFVIQYRQHME